MAKLELYGTGSCPYTEELREWLTVPILVEDGRVIQVGWHGRGCVVGSRS
jgi:hypothetical protein